MRDLIQAWRDLCAFFEPMPGDEPFQFISGHSAAFLVLMALVFAMLFAPYLS